MVFSSQKSVDFVYTTSEITLKKEQYFRILFAEKYTTTGCDGCDYHLTPLKDQQCAFPS